MDLRSRKDQLEEQGLILRTQEDEREWVVYDKLVTFSSRIYGPNTYTRVGDFFTLEEAVDASEQYIKDRKLEANN